MPYIGCNFYLNKNAVGTQSSVFGGCVGSLLWRAVDLGVLSRLVTDSTPEAAVCLEACRWYRSDL